MQKLIKEYAMSIIKKCNKNDINLMSEVKRFTKKIEKIHTPTNNIKKGAVKKLNGSGILRANCIHIYFFNYYDLY